MPRLDLLVKPAIYCLLLCNFTESADSVQDQGLVSSTSLGRSTTGQVAVDRSSLESTLLSTYLSNLDFLAGSCQVVSSSPAIPRRACFASVLGMQTTPRSTWLEQLPLKPAIF